MLHFEEINGDKGGETIVFLHGASGSHLEWDSVASQPSLASFHLILVDLAGHSGSKAVPFVTLAAAAREVHTVIQAHARGGRAHVVGFSLGGFVALELTARHPVAVRSTFATGAYPYRGLFRWAMARPTLMGLFDSVEIPGLAALMLRMQGIGGGDALLAVAKANRSRERTRNTMAELSRFGDDNVRAVAASGVRTLVVAGGRMDQVDAVRDMGQLLRNETGTHVRCEAAVVRHAFHPWHLQLPELFAAGVQAWAQDLTLPGELELL